MTFPLIKSWKPMLVVVCLVGHVGWSAEAIAGKDAPLTIQKISYLAKNCGSLAGFHAWLVRRSEIEDVVVSDMLLTSLPSIASASFKLNGKREVVRVTPDLAFSSRPESIQARSTLKKMNQVELASTEKSFDAEKHKQQIQAEVQAIDLMLKQLGEPK